MKIKTEGNQKEIIIAAAEKFGFTVCDVYKDSGHSNYPYLEFKESNGHDIAGTMRAEEIKVNSTFEEIMAHITGVRKPLVVRLNESYDAVITKSCVKVGCQTFTHAIIEELYNATKLAK